MSDAPEAAPQERETLPYCNQAGLKFRDVTIHIEGYTDTHVFAALGKPTLLMMVGLPNSGKSEFARTLKAPIVAPDAIRRALHGKRFLPDAEPMVWTVAHLMVKSLFQAGHKEVVLDACNVSRARRDEWRNSKWAVHFYHMVTPRDTCLERAERHDDKKLAEVIDRMWKEWEGFKADEWVTRVGRDGILTEDQYILNYRWEAYRPGLQSEPTNANSPGA